jgi:hypothetical protein
MSTAVQILIGKVEAYMRKFYLNQLIKGLILSFFLVIIGYLFVNLIEYFVWLPSFVRMIMFYSFVLFLIYLLVSFVWIPVINLLNFRKKMTIEQASVFIGKFFPEIDDRLLNTIQLSDAVSEEPNESELLIASIEQRTRKLSVFNFENAVNIRENYRFMPYLSFLFVVFICLWIFSPSFLIEPSNRFIHYNQHFTRPLPFSVRLLNEGLEVMQYDDYTVLIEVTGNEIPEKFFIVFNGAKNEMGKAGKNNFSFKITRVAGNITFCIESEEFKSSDYEIIVKPKPVLSSYLVQIEYPVYLNREAELLKETSILSVPVGTKLNWKFFTHDCLGVMINYDSVVERLEAQDGLNTLLMQVMGDVHFSVNPFNSYAKQSHGLEIVVEVIQDNYPEINVNLEKEQLGRMNYFNGFVSDDYGFTGLRFVYDIYATDASVITNKVEVPMNFTLLQQQFYFSWDTDSMRIDENSRVEAYFEVIDNDRIGGPKTRKSSVFQLTLMTDKSIDSLVKNDEKNINDQLVKLRNDSQQLKLDYEALAKSLLMKEKLDWKDKSMMQKLLERQQKVQMDFDDVKSKQQIVNDFNRERNETNERLVQKQEDIQKLFDEVITDELQKLLDELKALLQETDKEKVKEMLDKFKENSAEMEEMLDRDLALLNQLKVEKDLTELISQLRQLSEVAKKLGDSLQSEGMKKVESAREIQKNLDQFKTLTNSLDSIESKNKKLEQPFNLAPTEELKDSVKNNMQESLQEIEDGKGKPAGEKQRKAGESLDEMANQLEFSMQESMNEQAAEDAQQLRNLLENILRASNEQEELLSRLRLVDSDDPAFNEIVIEQKSLRDGFIVVEDSLKALASRQVAIKQFVFDELSSVKKQFEFSLLALNERNRERTLESDQFAVMSLNNLALMLSEALKDMEEKMGMQSSASGKGKPKPGKGKGKGMKSMRELQEGLAKQMKQKGEKNGKGEGKGLTSEEFAKMAAQQEAIRQQLQDYLNELKKEGNLGEGGLQNAIKEMEKVEEDLVNKRLNREMIERQQDILSRLLESEKAEKERDQEERRESNEFKGENKGNLGDKISYKRKERAQSDILYKFPIELRPYYKTRANEYFMQINK